MSVTALHTPGPSQGSPDWAPLLRWLVFTGLTAFAGFLLWR